MKIASDMTAFFNAAPHDPFLARPGQIYASPEGFGDLLFGLANDANLDAAALSEPLNIYATGYRDPDDLAAILDRIAPPVPVGRRFSYKEHSSKEDFMIDSDDGDVRPIGGNFKTLDSKGVEREGKTHNKGLMMVIDDDQGGENIEVQQRAVASLRNRLLRTEIYRVTRVLEANDNNSSSNWGASNAARDPDADYLTLVDTSGTKRGISPNIVLQGGGSRVKRIIALRSKASPDEVGARLTDKELAEFLGVRDVVTLTSAYQATGTAKAKILGDKSFAYYAAPDATVDDPSNLKRFVTMTPSGMFRVYVLPKLKRTVVAVEHYSDVVCTSTIGIEGQTVTFT